MSQNTGLHQVQRCQAQALVTHTAQLTMAIVAIGNLNIRIVQQKLREVFSQGLSHGFMADMPHGHFVVLRRSGFSQNGVMAGTAFRHGHPGACPKPQGHQAQQEAQEKASHSQIISQGPGHKPMPLRKHLSECGQAKRPLKHPTQ